jgi:molybdopterin-guanine dinucleotide biosynthesis protein
VQPHQRLDPIGVAGTQRGQDLAVRPDLAQSDLNVSCIARTAQIRSDEPKTDTVSISPAITSLRAVASKSSSNRLASAN